MQLEVVSTLMPLGEKRLIGGRAYRHKLRQQRSIKDFPRMLSFTYALSLSGH